MCADGIGINAHTHVDVTCFNKTQVVLRYVHFLFDLVVTLDNLIC